MPGRGSSGIVSMIMSHNKTLLAACKGSLGAITELLRAINLTTNPTKITPFPAGKYGFDIYF
jgi:hypothetical protein